MRSMFDMFEVGTGLVILTPNATPTRVQLTWLDRPLTTQSVIYSLGLKNTPGSTLVMLGSSSAGSQIFVLSAEEVLQPLVLEEPPRLDSPVSDQSDGWDMINI